MVSAATRTCFQSVIGVQACPHVALLLRAVAAASADVGLDLMPLHMLLEDPFLLEAVVTHATNVAGQT